MEHLLIGDVIILLLLGVVAIGIHKLHRGVQCIMGTQTELAAQIGDLKAQLVKVKAEIIAKVAALEAAIASAGQTTPEVDQAIADLRGEVQGLDDLNPDA